MMLLYEGIGLIRRLIRHSTLAVAVEDILYWLACAVLLFRMLYLENSGTIRGFSIAAVILGMGLYLQTAKRIKKLTKKLHKTVKGGIMSVNSPTGQKKEEKAGKGGAQ